MNRQNRSKKAILNQTSTPKQTVNQDRQDVDATMTTRKYQIILRLAIVTAPVLLVNTAGLVESGNELVVLPGHTKTNHVIRPLPQRWSSQMHKEYSSRGPFFPLTQIIYSPSPSTSHIKQLLNQRWSPARMELEWHQWHKLPHQTTQPTYPSVLRIMLGTRCTLLPCRPNQNITQVRCRGH